MTRRPVRGGGRPHSAVPSHVPTPSSSTMTTPMSSAYPSTYTSEADTEDEVNKLQIASLTLDTPLIPLKRKSRVPATPFPFLSLPSELRVKVYEHYFSDADEVLDLGPDNYKRMHKTLGFMRVCKQIHAEATHFFYSSRCVRIFPTYPGKYFKSRKPMLARLKPRQRQCITNLELRLGPGFNAPPRGWVVNDALGLKDCSGVKKVTVFVECDPSDGVFKGFRRSEGFYEGFSRNLLTSVLNELPHVNVVEFDAWNSVKKTGAMMHGLLDVANGSKRLIRWGPERGWTDGPEKEEKSKDSSAQYVDSIPIQGYVQHNVVVVA